MSKKVWFAILVAVALMMALSACQKSASNAPVTTPTATGNQPFPTPLPNNAINNVMAGTQTAVAMTPQLAETPLAGASATATQVPATTKPLPTATVVPAVPTATNTVVVVPSATPGHPATYTLQKGEFPFCIARRYNLSIASLLSLNGLTVDSKPAVGTVLNLPADTTWNTGPRSLKTHPATYTVVDGDTIYSIACAFGDADPNAIIAANNLKSPYTLTAGQTLQIP